MSVQFSALTLSRDAWSEVQHYAGQSNNVVRVPVGDGQSGQVDVVTMKPAVIVTVEHMNGSQRTSMDRFVASKNGAVSHVQTGGNSKSLAPATAEQAKAMIDLFNTYELNFRQWSALYED